MAYIVMAGGRLQEGLYSYGLYGYGLYSYGRRSLTKGAEQRRAWLKFCGRVAVAERRAVRHQGNAVGSITADIDTRLQPSDRGHKAFKTPMLHQRQRYLQR